MPAGPRGKLDKHRALRAVPLLREFTDVGVRILAEASAQRTVPRGAYAFRAGEASDSLAFIASGRLRLVGRDGGTALGEVSDGDTLGGMSLLVEGEHLISAMAATDAELLELPRATFEEMKKTHPRTALKLTLALAQDLAERLAESKAPLREFLIWKSSKPT